MGNDSLIFFLPFPPPLEQSSNLYQGWLELSSSLPHPIRTVLIIDRFSSPARFTLW